MKRMIIGIVVAGAALLTTGGLAHADEASYQQYLIDHGYNSGFISPFPFNWGQAFADGYMLCDRLHAGATYSDLERQYGRLPYWHPIVDAAQSELCPDTLGR